MNPHKTIFIILGVLYLGIFGWALGIPSSGAAGIAAVGMLLCYTGWKFSDHYL